MELFTLDFESYWSDTVSLSKMSSIEYVMHEETDIISCSIKRGDNETEVVFGEKEVGADRIVCSYGAWKLFKDNALIVDFGTATTIDIILKNGDYQGGLILPGLSLSRDVLAERTAKLPHIDLSEPPVLIGQTTVESMQSGLVHGYRAMIDGLIEKIEDKLKIKPKKIFCGGYATLIAASLKHTPDLIDPYLILKSLSDLSDLLN
jgi:type III pantothenate kinase